MAKESSSQPSMNLRAIFRISVLLFAIMNCERACADLYLEGSCSDDQSIKYIINSSGRMDFAVYEFKTNIYLYSIRQGPRNSWQTVQTPEVYAANLNYERILSDLSQQGIPSEHPFAICNAGKPITDNEKTPSAFQTYVTCTNTNNDQLSANEFVEGVINGVIRVLPSANGLRSETEVKATNTYYSCAKNLAVSFAVGRIKAGDTYINDRIYLSVSSWTPNDVRFERQTPATGDYKF